MHPAFVVAEFVRKDPSLIKLRVHRLIVLAAIILPPIFLHEETLRRLLVVVQIVQHEDVSGPMQNDIEYQSRHRDQREMFEPFAGEPLVDASDVAAIQVSLRPLADMDTLGFQIDAIYAIADTM